MKHIIWTLATCIPSDSAPCIPSVFTDEATAQAAFDRAMRGAWESNAPINNDSGEPLEYPEGNPLSAHDAMAAKNRDADRDDLWGEYTLTAHTVDLPDVSFPATPAAAPPDLVQVARTAVSACDILAEECEQDGEITARDIWRGKAERARSAVKAHATDVMMPPETRSSDILARIRAI